VQAEGTAADSRLVPVEIVSLLIKPQSAAGFEKALPTHDEASDEEGGGG